LRRAARGLLPDRLRSRPKTPLNGHPEFEAVRRDGMPPPFPSPLLSSFGDIRVLSESGSDKITSVQASLRFVALSYWLRDRASFTSLHQRRNGMNQEQQQSASKPKQNYRK